MAIPHLPHGYVPNPAETERYVSTLKYPTLATAGPKLAIDEKKDTVLYPYLLKVKPGYSRNAQAIGSCCGHGWAMNVDLLSSVQIAVHGFLEDWPGRCLEASIYGFSRCEARGVKINPGGDGSYGAACAKAVSQFGTLHYDVDYAGETFSSYSGLRESQWGRTGVPDKLEPFAAKHRVKTVTRIESFEDFARACQAGFPTAVCSMQAFTMTRDKDGFCVPPARGQWPHCMALGGVRFGRRPGALVYQSWGANSNSGPHYSGNPDAPEFPDCYFKNSTFWADADVIDRMLRAGDSFSVSSYEGFPPRKLPDWTGDEIL
jgi:hypothetical protein